MTIKCKLLLIWIPLTHKTAAPKCVNSNWDGYMCGEQVCCMILRDVATSLTAVGIQVDSDMWSLHNVMYSESMVVMSSSSAPTLVFLVSRGCSFFNGGSLLLPCFYWLFSYTLHHGEHHCVRVKITIKWIYEIVSGQWRTVLWLFKYVPIITLSTVWVPAVEFNIRPTLTLGGGDERWMLQVEKRGRN